MWANAQRDGRPAEYRWLPLFSAAKFGWRPLLECHAVTLPRRETCWNLQGCPKLTKRSQPLVGRSSPYYGDMWRRFCCLTSFFSDCRYVLHLRRYSLTNLWDGAQMATFWRFFACCIFSEQRATRFRPATSNNLCFCTTCQNEETRKSHFSLSWIVLYTMHLCAVFLKEKIVICDVFDSV